MDFQDMKWERGDITLLFQGECQPGKMVVIMDNARKVYQMVEYPVSTDAVVNIIIDIINATSFGLSRLLVIMV